MRRATAFVIITLVAILATVAAILFLRPVMDGGKVSGVECELRGGRVVNTLGLEPGSDFCAGNGTDIGSIPGMKCPCVCCVP